MKYIIVLLVLIAITSAAPVDETFEDAALALNFTRAAARLVGFAGSNGGVHGGAGGETWTVWDAFALRTAIDNNQPRIVYVRGCIDLTELFTGSPGVRLSLGSFTSLIGGDRNAEITGGGVRISTGRRQVIIHNMKFSNAVSYGPGEYPNGNGGIVSQAPGPFSEIDNVEVFGSENVWVDHCEFSDDPWNAAATPADRRRHDGLLDIVRGANYVTVSNSIFRNHNHVMLIGNNDNNGAQDNGRLKVTLFANWFQGTNQRNPRVRFGEVHILNNLYTDVTDWAIAVGVSAKIIAARNVFINTRRVLSVAFNNNNPGYILMDTNRFVNSPLSATISSSGVNWTPTQYYEYRAIPIGEVENHVRNTAGAWR